MVCDQCVTNVWLEVWQGGGQSCEKGFMDMLMARLQKVVVCGWKSWGE